MAKILNPVTFTRKRSSSTVQGYLARKNRRCPISVLGRLPVSMNVESTTSNENTGNEPTSSPQGENVGTFGKGVQW